MELKDYCLPPPMEAGAVVGLFDAAADALLANDIVQADGLLTQADMASLHHHAERLWGPNNPEIHCWSVNPAYKVRTANPLPKSERDSSKVSAAMIRDIFSRDGWHCRYCSIPVMSDAAFKALRKFPLRSLRWGNAKKDLHLGAVLIWGVLDHVVPVSAGGRTVPENLVASCWLCNAAKWDATLEEAGLTDPRSRQPFLDAWDGLTRLLAGG